MKKVEYRQAILYQAPSYFTRQEFREELIPYPEHCHDFYEFFLVASGRILHRINGREKILSAGTLQLIRPSDIHQPLPVKGGEGGVIYNCNIKKEEFIPQFSFLTDSSRCSADDLVQTIDLSASPELPGLIFRLKKAMEAQDNAGLPDFLRNALSRNIQQEVVCLFLERTVRDERNEPEWLATVFTEMRKPENFLAGIPRMIELAGRSREHLCRSLRQYYGMTPREYILELKLRRVTELLARRDFSIIDAATRAGFDNLAYFRKCFRARYGITPRLYRRRCEGS